jgi:glycosyltransferase involved in cell wall biosynthesis
MTVLHIVGTLNAGGIERLVTDLCEYQQTVFADRPAVACFIRRQGQFVERLLGLGIPVFDVGPRFGLQVVAAVRLTGVLRQLRPDIVHTHVNFSLPWQFAPLRLYGVPAVITQHTTFGLSPPVKLRAGLSYRLLKGCRFVHTAVSTCSADYAAELYRTARAAIKVIPNGIRGAAFGFRQKDREARRAQWRVGPGTLVLGTLGRVTEVKGFDI